MLRDLDSVALAQDLPDAGLTAGDIGAIVHVCNSGSAYEVEFVALTGETLALLTLPAAALRPVVQGEIAHARKVA
jgi:Domain of unknown function (DUF4926)